MRPLSARNRRVAGLARLVRRRDERAAQQALIVEGPVLLGAALDAGATVTDVYVDETVVHQPAMAALLGRADLPVEPWSLPAGVLDRVGDAATSQGVLAVVERPEPSWPIPDRVPFVVVLDDVADPGNVGTLMRAAAASGAGAVVAAGGADPSSPKVVRASAGAWFAVDVLCADQGAEAVRRLRSVGYRVVVAAVRGGDAHHRAPLDLPLALVVGNETRGVGAEVAAAADGAVTVEMAGPTESLNAAMAGTVLCFEVLRRRQL